MSEAIDLKQLERRAWRSVFQDGLWDIFLGLLLLAMAIGAWLSNSGVSETVNYSIYGGLMVLAMLVLWAGKKFVTTPRLGRVKFGPKRRRARGTVRLILALSVVVGLVLALIGVWVQGDSDLAALQWRVIVPAVWAVNMIVLFSLGAYFLDFPRLYIIAVLYAIPLPIDALLIELAGIHAPAVTFGISALAILAMGLVVFARFLRDYPMLPEPVAEGNGLGV